MDIDTCPKGLLVESYSVADRLRRISTCLHVCY